MNAAWLQMIIMMKGAGVVFKCISSHA